MKRLALLAAFAGMSLGLASARDSSAGDDPVVPILERYRAAKDDALARRALVAELGALGSSGADSALGQVLAEDLAETVRIAAVAALGSRANEGAAKILLDRLRESDPYVNDAIARALATSCPDKVLTWVAEHGFDRAAAVELRSASVEILVVSSRAVTARADTRRKILGAALDTEPRVREAAARALAHLEGAECERALEALAGDESVRVRVAALEALGSVPGDKATKRLRDALERDRVWQARVASVRALSRREPSDPAPWIKVVRDEKADSRVRIACLDQLARVRTKEVVTGLVAAVRDDPGRPHADLRRALRTLTGTDALTAADWRAWWASVQSGFAFADAPPVLLPRTQARFYDLPLDSLKIDFLIDASGSMADRDPRVPRPRFEVAEDELRKAVGALPPAAVFGVVAFKDRAIAIQETPIARDKVGEVLPALAAVHLDGSTDLVGALAALLHGSGPCDPESASEIAFDTVCLISDGVPTSGATTEFAEIRRRVRDWNRFAQVRIHTVSIGPECDDLLAGLASDSGGAHVRR